MKFKIKVNGAFILGVVICFAIAGLSVFLEKQIPGELLGASIIALFMGTLSTVFFILSGLSLHSNLRPRKF